MELLEHRRVADLRHGRRLLVRAAHPRRSCRLRPWYEAAAVAPSCHHGGAWTSSSSRPRASATPRTCIASDGEAALVDPQRDAWRFLAVAEERGWRVRHVLETHVHNDYLSGALETRAATGARIAAPAQGGYAFDHDGADEGTTIELGGLRLVAMATPGHTPEHLAWAIHDADAAADAPPSGVFTGGSLLVGTAGRTDLLGAGQNRSADTASGGVAPTPRRAARGGPRAADARSGQLLQRGPVRPRTRRPRIGAERFANPVLRALDGPGLRRRPARRARQVPRLLRADGADQPGRAAGPRRATERAADERRGLRRRGVPRRPGRGRSRPPVVRGRAHPGLPEHRAGRRLRVVRRVACPVRRPARPRPSRARRTRPPRDAAIRLARVGYEHVAGYLAGGVEAWIESGRPARSYPTTTIQDLFDEARRHANGDGREPQADLLDVRQPNEWRDDGIIPGSRTIFVADLPARLAELPRDHEITVLCKAGSRASIAASLLDGAGIPVRLVASGGAAGWATRFAQLQAPGAGGRP